MTIQVSIIPNPFDLILDIEVTVSNNEPAIITITDQQQNVVKLMRWRLKKGVNKTTFGDLEALPPGNYFVNISNMNGEHLYNTKLLKIT